VSTSKRRESSNQDRAAWESDFHLLPILSLPARILRNADDLHSCFGECVGIRRNEAAGGAIGLKKRHQPEASHPRQERSLLSALLALVFLQECPAFGWSRAAALARQGLVLKKLSLRRASPDPIAECSQERLMPAAQYFQLAIRRCRGSLASTDKQWKCPRPSLVSLLRKWRVVGGDHFRRQLGYACALHDPPHASSGHFASSSAIEECIRQRYVAVRQTQYWRRSIRNRSDFRGDA